MAAEEILFHYSIKSNYLNYSFTFVLRLVGYSHLKTFTAGTSALLTELQTVQMRISDMNIHIRLKDNR
jgi:hypothetical protein